MTDFSYEPAASPASLRSNQRRALRALAWTDGLTRSELAARLGLPKATLAGVLDSLVRLGLVSEAPSPTLGGRRAGRPPRLVSLSGHGPAVGAIVYSGGMLSTGLVSYSGSVLARMASWPSVHNLDDELFSLGAEALASACAQPAAVGRALTGVVVGVPTPVTSRRPSASEGADAGAGPGLTGSRGGHVRLVAHEVVTGLEGRLGVPVLVENDANLGALGEATFGAGVGVDTFLYLKLARGVGAGVVVGRRLHRGATGYAGELGHVHVNDDGPVCGCGGRGCLHGILGDALVRSVQPAYDRTLSFRDVLDLAAGGEPAPQRALEDLGRAVGRPLADFVTLLNPEAIIVDGSFAAAAAHVVKGLRESLDRFAAPLAAKALRVLPGALGDDADLLGAAALARAELDQRP